MVVTAGGETHVRTFPGKVEASRKVELAFRVPGEIVELPVKEGVKKVARGDLIAKIRPDDFKARLKTVLGDLDKARANLKALQAGERPEERLRRETQVRSARAKLANARTEYERNQRLLPSNAVSRAEYERSETALRVAEEDYQAAVQSLEKASVAREEDILAKQAAIRGLEGRVVEAQIQVDDCTLLAPFDGVIARRFVELNQTVQAHEPIVRLQDDEIEIAVDVPETVMAADISRADILELLAEFSAAPGVQFPVRIQEIAKTADPVTQTFRVRVAMKARADIRLLPGMTATATLKYRRARVLGNRILVPASAVSQDGTGKQVAWVVGPEDKVSPRAVKLGEATGDLIEVVDGLAPGDRIAVAGVTFLRDGMKVRDLGDALGGG
jgi:RND family efflux transporter MFP subunit